MKKVLLMLAFIAGTLNAKAQPDTFTVVQEMPYLPGYESINAFIAEHIIYPAEAKDNGIQGAVYVEFVVDTTGQPVNARIARGIPNGRMLEGEALRVINMMPRWEPGKQNGKPVCVRYTVPVRFHINDTKAARKKRKAGKKALKQKQESTK